MKQKVEFIRTDSGKNMRFQMEQSQKEFALSRDEVVFLTQIPERFLLDEIASRGYSLSGRTVLLKNDTAFADKLLDAIIDTFVIVNERSIKELFPYIVNRAVQRFGTQKQAAKVLGITSRKANYWVKGRYELYPNLVRPDAAIFAGLITSGEDSVKSEEKETEPIDVVAEPEVVDDWDW